MAFFKKDKKLSSLKKGEPSKPQVSKDFLSSVEFLKNDSAVDILKTALKNDDNQNRREHMSKNLVVIIAGVVAVIFAFIGLQMLTASGSANAGVTDIDLFGILKVSTTNLAVALLAIAAIIIIYAIRSVTKD